MFGAESEKCVVVGDGGATGKGRRSYLGTVSVIPPYFQSVEIHVDDVFCSDKAGGPRSAPQQSLIHIKLGCQTLATALTFRSSILFIRPLLAVLFAFLALGASCAALVSFSQLLHS